MVTITTVVLVVAGLASLFLGRRLFWLFVAIVGFGVGMVLAPQFLGMQSELILLIAAFAGGFIGAMLALALQEVAVAIAGFAVGSYFAFWILEVLGIYMSGAVRDSKWWLIFIIGGAIGAVLVLALFDYALIFLSSSAGALLIVESLKQPLSLSLSVVLFLFLVLLLVGVVVQTVAFKKG